MKAALLASAFCLAATAAFAGQVIPTGPFTGVSGTDGAHIVIRHGAALHVELVKGSTQYTRIEVKDGTLHVDTCANDSWHCPHHYELEVAVVMPDLRDVSATDGASVEAAGEFPAQDALHAHATDGGSTDTRAIAAQHVSAKADDGGNIRVRAVQSLDAKVDDGGNIEYWGSPHVNIAATDGGSVSSGE